MIDVHQHLWPEAFVDRLRPLPFGEAQKFSFGHDAPR